MHPSIAHGLQARLQPLRRPQSASVPVLHVTQGGSLRTFDAPKDRVDVSCLTDTHSVAALPITSPQQRLPRSISTAATPKRSVIAAQVGKGALATEMPPPTPIPDSEIPAEYHVYELAANRRPAVIAEHGAAQRTDESGAHGSPWVPSPERRPRDESADDAAGRARYRYRVFPATRPSSRSEVLQLGRALDRMLEAAGESTAEALNAWDLTFSELVRQAFVACADRGELLGRVRRAYDHYLGALIARVRHMEGTEREVEYRQLQMELATFKEMNKEGEQRATKLQVASLFRSAAAEERGVRRAETKAEMRIMKAEMRAGGAVQQTVSAFNQCSEAEQLTVWRDLLFAAPTKSRLPILMQLWKLFPESRRPEMVRDLAAELSDEAQTGCVLQMASQCTYEERIGLVERLLREFSAFEMSSFVDFLPYIWEDLAVQFATKLLSRMSAADRTRISSQLQREEEAAAKTALAASREDAVASVVAASAAEKVILSIDPSNLLPDELPGWEALGAAASGENSYDLSRVMAITAEVFELALDSRDARGLERTSSRTVAPSFPRVVLNVLLRRVPPTTTQQKSGAAPVPSMIQQAREALWTLLTSLRSHAKGSPRAKLFARLCGVLVGEFDPRRVDVPLQLLSHLLSASEQRRLLTDLATGEGLLPMDGQTIAAPALAKSLHAFEHDLGGAQRVNALIERLRERSKPDPQPVPLAETVIDCDVALLLVLDAFDSAKQKLGASLSILHDQLEVQRASGALDANGFIVALCNFDTTLSESTAAAIYIDCEMAAADERARGEAANDTGSKPSGGRQMDRRGARASRDKDVVGGVVARREMLVASIGAAAHDAVPLKLFVEICEAHGVTKSER